MYFQEVIWPISFTPQEFDIHDMLINPFHTTFKLYMKN